MKKEIASLSLAISLCQKYLDEEIGKVAGWLSDTDDVHIFVADKAGVKLIKWEGFVELTTAEMPTGLAKSWAKKLRDLADDLENNS